MQNKIVYDDDIYSKTNRKMIKYDGEFYMRHGDWIRVNKKTYYRTAALKLMPEESRVKTDDVEKLN